MIEVCKFETNNSGNLKCTKCGYVYRGNATNPIRNCGKAVEGPILRTKIDLPTRPKPERPEPSLATKAKNFLSAAASFVADGCATVSKEEYEARLTVCDSCPSRRGNSCKECGCKLALKAKGRAFHCPLKKWAGDE